MRRSNTKERIHECIHKLQLIGEEEENERRSEETGWEEEHWHFDNYCLLVILTKVALYSID